MVNEPAFLRDPYLTTLETTVVAQGEDPKGNWVLLADTIFYPEGGGQPADRGTIAGVPVVDVQKGEEGIRHYVTTPLAHGSVRLQLDWQRRFDHMQQHTGQHLLSALAEDRFGWRTTAFHLGSERCDVELAVPALSADNLALLEEAVAAEIRAARPVRPHWVAPEGLALLPGLRTRGLPQGHQGPVRLVEIEGVDLNTCGGTHVANTAQVEALVLLGTEPMRGGTRVYFVAGGRVRRRLHQHEARNAALRTLLNASDDELVGVAEAKLGQLAEANRKLRQAREAWGGLLGRELAQRGEALVHWHSDEPDLAFLQVVARAFLGETSAKVLLLTSGGASSQVFLLASHRPDLQDLGQQLANRLGAKGGGSGPVFQAKCPPGAAERIFDQLVPLLQG